MEVPSASYSSRASFLDLVVSLSMPHVRGRRTTAYRLSSSLFPLVASSGSPTFYGFGCPRSHEPMIFAPTELDTFTPMTTYLRSKAADLRLISLS